MAISSERYEQLRILAEETKHTEIEKNIKTLKRKVDDISAIESSLSPKDNFLDDYTTALGYMRKLGNLKRATKTVAVKYGKELIKKDPTNPGKSEVIYPRDIEEARDTPDIAQRNIQPILTFLEYAKKDMDKLDEEKRAEYGEKAYAKIIDLAAKVSKVAESYNFTDIKHSFDALVQNSFKQLSALYEKRQASAEKKP